MPNLIWNMMMSVSGGWFFVVASEAITVAGHSIQLPGIGSYIAVAIEKQDLSAIYYAVLVMFIVIVLYDQLLFRPLLAWSRKFKVEELGAEEPERPWFLVMVQRARIFDLIEFVAERLRGGLGALARSLTWRPTLHLKLGRARRPLPPWAERLWDALLIVGALAALVWLIVFIRTSIEWPEVGEVILLGLATAIRVLVLIAIVSEVVRWGDTTLTATGIGAYIAKWTEAGDSQRIALGITVLCLYVIVFNRLFWRRLYDIAAERLRLD